MATTNQMKLVATMGTPTEANTVQPLDIHLDAKQKPVEHPNSVATSKCTSGMTTKQTTIDGHQIVLQEATNIGPPSVQPWPGQVGKTSGVTGMEANVKKGSPNVQAEKMAIARYNDPTLHNRKNCDGKIIITNDALAASMLAQQKLLRCKMSLLETKCGHGRVAAKDKLSVLVGDTVTLTATRINALEMNAAGQPTGAKAECEKAPLHTHFVVTRTTVKTFWMNVLAESKTYTGSDTLTLGKEWLGEAPAEKPADNGIKDKVKATEEPVKAGPFDLSLSTSRVDQDNATSASDIKPPPRPANLPPPTPARLQNQFLTQNANRPPKMPLGADGLTTRQRDRVDTATVEYQQQAARSGALAQMQRHQRDPALLEKMKAADAKKTRDAYIEATLTTLIEVIKATPAKVTVEALSCAGSKKVDLWVWPRGRYVLDIMAFVQPIRNVMTVIKNSKDIFEKFFKLAGGNVTTKFNFCQNAYGMLYWEWKEKTDATVGPKFEIDFGFEKLIEFVAEFKVPILTFIGPYGRFAAWLLEKGGVRGDIGAFVGMFLGLSAAGSMWDWKFTPGAVTVPIVFEIGIFAELVLRDSFTLRIEVKAEWKPTFKRVLNMANGSFAGLQLEAGKVEFKIECVLKGDVIGLRGGRNFDLELGSWNYGAQTLNCLPDAPAANKTA